mmetsp:Transcript_18601/g.28120  ORF Transcript_18601/g.28120 Transcript_18601/m.28120 type:complete len:85 (-) Transcript_18601:2235-2489(-)
MAGEKKKKSKEDKKVVNEEECEASRTTENLRPTMEHIARFSPFETCKNLLIQTAYESSSAKGWMLRLPLIIQNIICMQGRESEE